jgi:hypothetical protein
MNNANNGKTPMLREPSAASQHNASGQPAGNVVPGDGGQPAGNVVQNATRGPPPAAPGAARQQ